MSIYKLSNAVQQQTFPIAFSFVEKYMPKANGTYVKVYLYDAGFNEDLYTLEDFNNEREYVEVFFCCNTAVSYVVKDIKGSEFSDLLEIKKYRYKNGICTAVITYI